MILMISIFSIIFELPAVYLFGLHTIRNKTKDNQQQKQSLQLEKILHNILEIKK